MTLYIRPVYNHKSQLLSLALCRSDQEILVDSQVIEHFDREESGKMIRKIAKIFHGANEVKWGNTINVA